MMDTQIQMGIYEIAMYSPFLSREAVFMLEEAKVETLQDLWNLAETCGINPSECNYRPSAVIDKILSAEQTNQFK